MAQLCPVLPMTYLFQCSSLSPSPSPSHYYMLSVARGAAPLARAAAMGIKKYFKASKRGRSASVVAVPSGGGGGPPKQRSSTRTRTKRSTGVVTKQRDWVPTPYVRLSKRSRIARKISRKRWSRFRRRIKKAIRSPHYITCLYQNISRCFKGTQDQQSVINIPIFSYRGNTATSPSTALGAVGATEFNFRNDNAEAILTAFVRNREWSGTGAASNSTQTSWWFKHLKSVVDISITNMGTTASADASNNRIEYDLYLCWANKKMNWSTTTPMNSANDWTNAYNTYEQDRFGQAAPINDTGIAEPAWTPYAMPLKKIGISSKKIGSGYIEQNETIRLSKSCRTKQIFTQYKWDKQDPSPAVTTRALMPGIGMYVLFVFRGMPTPGVADARITVSRVGVHCNWRHYLMFDGKNQSGISDQRLYADSYL